MFEMYLLTLLGKLSDITAAVAIVVLILLVVSIIFMPLLLDVLSELESKQEKFFKRSVKIAISVVLTSCILFLFIPSEKDMYKIIGIGGTYEYLKDNETAKELPDKVIIALDKILDKEIESEQ